MDRIKSALTVIRGVACRGSIQKIAVSQQTSIHFDSDCLRVARGGSRAKAPPLAARPIVHVSRLFVRSSSGMYGICYLTIFDYLSVVKCATGPARDSEVCPRRPQMI